MSSGTLEVLGESAGRLRREIGYVPQHGGFDAALNIRGWDVVRLGLDGDRWGLPVSMRSTRRRETNARIAEVLRLVGAEEYAHRPVGQLSGQIRPRCPIPRQGTRVPVP